MHYEGHQGMVHSNVSHHLQPYSSRLQSLYIVSISTNATYDVSQRTYNCGFAGLWTGDMFFFYYKACTCWTDNVVDAHFSFKFKFIFLHAHICVCACVPVCASTKEAVNLTMSAGRTSGCPIVHLGKQPTSNNIGLFILVSYCSSASRSRDLMHPPAAGVQRNAQKCGFPSLQKNKKIKYSVSLMLWL